MWGGDDLFLGPGDLQNPLVYPLLQREQQEASLIPVLGGVHPLQKTKGRDWLVDLLKHLRQERAGWLAASHPTSALPRQKKKLPQEAAVQSHWPWAGCQEAGGGSRSQPQLRGPFKLRSTEKWSWPALLCPLFSGAQGESQHPQGRESGVCTWREEGRTLSQTRAGLSREHAAFGGFGHCSLLPTALSPDAGAGSVCWERLLHPRGKDKSYFVLRAIIKQAQFENGGGDARCRMHLPPRWASEHAAAFVPFPWPRLCPSALINLIRMLNGHPEREEEKKTDSLCLSSLCCSPWVGTGGASAAVHLFQPRATGAGPPQGLQEDAHGGQEERWGHTKGTQGEVPQQAGEQ